MERSDQNFILFKEVKFSSHQKREPYQSKFWGFFCAQNFIVFHHCLNTSDNLTNQQYVSECFLNCCQINKICPILFALLLHRQLSQEHKIHLIRRYVLHILNVVVQLLSCFRFFVTPWTAAGQVSLSFTIASYPQSFLALASFPESQLFASVAKVLELQL